MRISKIVMIGIIFGLSSPAEAQLATVEDYVKLITVDPTSLSEADCVSALSKANDLNPAGLFRASSICAAVHKEIESSFLLTAGQVRATADMSVMVPATKADLGVVAALYGFIYSYAGGPGADEVFRDPSARDSFFKLLDVWKPAYSPEYSPGWNVGKRPDGTAYQQALTESKASRRSQLIDLSSLYSDDRYYALHRQLTELQKRTSGRYVEGTADAKLLNSLQKRMAQLALDLGIDHGQSDVEAAEDSRKSPPSAPGKDETVVTVSADPTVKQCSDWADRLALMSVSKVYKVVMTTGSEWGLVWRADIASSDKPPEMSRFICSKYGTMHESGDGGDRPPLP